MKIVIYSLTDYEIIRAIDCPEEMVDLQAGDGEGVLIGEGGDLTHFVYAGLIVAYTDEQAAAKAVRPRYPCAWSNRTFSWVDLRDIERVRSDRWEAMKGARDAYEFGGFTWDESVFDSDTDSQNHILLYVTQAMQAQAEGTPFSEVWTLKDNSERVLDAADMIAVGNALVAHLSTTAALGRAVRAEIDAASDAAAVALVVWPA